MSTPAATENPFGLARHTEPNIRKQAAAAPMGRKYHAYKLVL